MLNERKKTLLNSIITEHIRTGRTVGSKALVDKYGLGFSPATVRNEMMALEKEGYIRQPHISAGRLPTERGWRYYLDNSLLDKSLKSGEQQLLKKIINNFRESEEELLKNLAKGLAEISHNSVIVAFSPDSTYYTGISHLFRQPEFAKLDLVCHVSDLVDHLDEVVNKIFNQMDKDIKVILGKENPFGEECGAILSKPWMAKRKELIGILGPRRMDYGNNIARLKYIQKILNQTN